MTTAVAQALKDAGARLKRNKKHLVYELPNGRNVVLSKTPSDVHAENQALRDIRAAAGLVESEKRTDARPKRHKPGREDRSEWSLQVPVAVALRDSGVYERRLHDRITELEQLLVEAGSVISGLEEELVACRARADRSIWAHMGALLLGQVA